MTIRLKLPIQTVSEMNRRDHWATRDRRRKAQRKEVYYEWRKLVRRKPMLPVLVKLTREGPKLLDSDNNIMSFKAIRDCVAELIGVDDGSEQIKFEYAQTQQPSYGVVIEVSPL